MVRQAIRVFAMTGRAIKTVIRKRVIFMDLFKKNKNGSGNLVYFLDNS